MLVSLRSLLGSLVCGTVLFTAVGCGCEPTRHPVNVSLSPQFRDKPAVEVVIAALNADEAAYLAAYPMSRFFSPGDNEYRGLDKVVLNFGPEKPTSQSFNAAVKDQWELRWKAWEAKHATQLFVMAFLPARFDDKPGNLDARRIAVPLGSCKWEKKDQAISFELTPAKLELLTPPKPDKK